MNILIFFLLNITLYWTQVKQHLEITENLPHFFEYTIKEDFLFSFWIEIIEIRNEFFSIGYVLWLEDMVSILNFGFLLMINSFLALPFITYSFIHFIICSEIFLLGSNISYISLSAFTDDFIAALFCLINMGINGAESALGVSFLILGFRRNLTVWLYNKYGNLKL